MLDAAIAAIIGAIVAMLGTLISFEYRQYRSKKIEYYENIVRGFGKAKLNKIRLEQRSNKASLNFRHPKTTDEINALIEATEHIIEITPAAKLYLSRNAIELTKKASERVLHYTYVMKASLALNQITEDMSYGVIAENTEKIESEIKSFEKNIELAMRRDIQIVHVIASSTFKTIT